MLYFSLRVTEKVLNAEQTVPLAVRRDEEIGSQEKESRGKMIYMLVTYTTLLFYELFESNNVVYYLSVNVQVCL